MKNTHTILEPAGREEQLKRWGLDPSPRWSGVERANYVDLDAEDADFMRAGGWSIVDPEHDGRASGAVAHRGVVHPEEHIDWELVARTVESVLGFSLDELHSVYSTGGRIRNNLRGLRERIDARLLALSRAGGNMDLFARATELTPRTLDYALARARAAEVSA